MSARTVVNNAPAQVTASVAKTQNGNFLLMFVISMNLNIKIGAIAWTNRIHIAYQLSTN